MAAKTWWVRPDTGHNSTRDGTSYETAWGGWGEIVWGGLGVNGANGDTLILAGNHVYSANTSIGAHGGNSLSAMAKITCANNREPGFLTWNGNYFMGCGRSYTWYDQMNILGGTASSLIYHNGTLTGITHTNGIYKGSGYGTPLSFAGNGNNFTDVVIDSNDFSGDVRFGGASSGAISWYTGSTNDLSTLTRFTVTRNNFHDLITGRAALHLRTTNLVNTGTKMVDVVVEDNTFNNVQGFCIEVDDLFGTLGHSQGLRVRRNKASNCTYSPAGTTGGVMSLGGFTSSAALGFPLIEWNSAYNITGGVGLIDLFYGNYIVRFNTGDTIYPTPTSTDGDGILFDHGCGLSYAYCNTIRNLYGRDGIVNSGVGLMILDCTNINMFCNLIDGCRTGLHLGAAGSGQSGAVDFNTFLNVREHGTYILSSATPNNVPMRNNAYRALTSAANSVSNLGAAWTGEDYNAWQGFAAASGHSLGGNDLSIADLMVTPDGRPLPGSPLLGAGTYLSTVTRDFDLKQRRNPPAIGAFDLATLRTGT